MKLAERREINARLNASHLAINKSLFCALCHKPITRYSLITSINYEKYHIGCAVKVLCQRVEDLENDLLVERNTPLLLAEQKAVLEKIEGIGRIKAKFNKVGVQKSAP